MDFRKSTTVDQPINQVWDLLGNQYGEAYKWASGLYHSIPVGKPKIEGAICNNRTCELPSGMIKEEVRKFDAKNHILSYEVIEGFPFFVDQAINTWTLQAQGNKTRVDMHLVMTTKGFVGKLMQPMLKLQMGNLLQNAIDDFKHYSETGKPSPRKAKEIAKLAKKAA
ncbi:MAG: SRPBCC family protein [Bacteroidota bacterium]